MCADAMSMCAEVLHDFDCIGEPVAGEFRLVAGRVVQGVQHGFNARQLPREFGSDPVRSGRAL
jgi:hypothetical protein